MQILSRPESAGEHQASVSGAPAGLFADERNALDELLDESFAEDLKEHLGTEPRSRTPVESLPFDTGALVELIGSLRQRSGQLHNLSKE
jgi:hypothetical protein